MTSQALSKQKIHLSKEIIRQGIEDKIAYTTQSGALYKGDVLEIIPYVNSKSVDTVFADPPFNLSKVYGPKVNDDKSDEDYINWCRSWLDECIRVVKPGGAIFLYNIPKWNIILGNHLAEAGMMFRHWIGIEIESSDVIIERLKTEDLSPHRSEDYVDYR